MVVPSAAPASQPVRSPSVISISSDDGDDVKPHAATRPPADGAEVHTPSVISLSSDSRASSVAPTQQRSVFVMPDSGVVVIPDSDDSDEASEARLDAMAPTASPRVSSPNANAQRPTNNVVPSAATEDHRSPSVIVISSDVGSQPNVAPLQNGSESESGVGSGASNKENVDSFGVDRSLAGGAPPGPRRLVSFAELAASPQKEPLTDLEDLFGEDIFAEDIVDDRVVPELDDRYSDTEDVPDVAIDAVPDDLSPFGDPMRFEMWPSLVDNPNPATQWVATLLFKWRVSICGARFRSSLWPRAYGCIRRWHGFICTSDGCIRSTEDAHLSRTL